MKGKRGFGKRVKERVWLEGVRQERVTKEGVRQERVSKREKGERR